MEDREPFHVIPMAYLELQKQAKYGERLEEEWNSMLENINKNTLMNGKNS